MPSRERVTAWADGFGRWYARVTFPAAEMAAEGRRVRRRAVRRIRAELTLRGECRPGWRCRVKPYDVARDFDGGTHSVTYRER